MAKQRPTRRQLEVLRAYIGAGSVAAAAYELGISETTVRQHLSGLCRRTGCANAAQAAYVLGRADVPKPVPRYACSEKLWLKQVPHGLRPDVVASR